MSVPATFTDFCAPWLQREPQLQLAMQFAAKGAERTRFLACTVLLREVCEAATAVSDVRVAQVKLGWWIEEAQHWAAGLPRHPLAHAFDPVAAAAALTQMVGATLRWLEAPGASTGADICTLFDPISIALAQIALPTPALAGRGLGEEGALISDALNWRLCWFACALRLAPTGGPGLASLLPLDLLARHGRRRSDWTAAAPEIQRVLIGDCAAAYPAVAAYAHSRALRALVAIEQRWLSRLAKGANLAQLRVSPGDAFAAWRAARQAAA